MILAVDVQYVGGQGFVSAVSFREWRASTPDHVYETTQDFLEAYIPGQFYKRELPCILKLLDEHELSPDVILIDGYVYLDRQQRPGLGMHLYHALDGRCPIIGVAKSRFYSFDENAELYRGSSKNPLFVTAAGMDNDRARQRIREMHGDNRVPTLLKLVDRLCREKAATPP